MRSGVLPGWLDGSDFCLTRVQGQGRKHAGSLASLTLFLFHGTGAVSQTLAHPTLSSRRMESPTCQGRSVGPRVPHPHPRPAQKKARVHPERVRRRSPRRSEFQTTGLRPLLKPRLHVRKARLWRRRHPRPLLSRPRPCHRQQVQQLMPPLLSLPGPAACCHPHR